MIADSRSIDTVITIHVFQIYLRRARQTCPYLLPMNQIFTVENRDSWEILESTVYQIKIITYPANTRIGMKAWKNRILKALSPTDKRVKQANCNYYTFFIHI